MLRIALLLFMTIPGFGAWAQYYSQLDVHQDRYLNENIFHNKKNGVFVDIGAYDGVSLSNTCFFERELNWKGICVEPNPDAYQKLIKNRTCTCVNGCISNTNEPMLYLKITNGPEMLSGLLCKYDPPHLLRIQKEVAAEGATTDVVSVPCFILQDILNKNQISHIDYLSIDTEGGELDILKSIDYDKVDINIIDVENNYYHPTFNEFLSSKGFVLIKTLSSDEIYQNKKYRDK